MEPRNLTASLSGSRRQMARVTVPCAVCSAPISKAAWEMRNDGQRCCSRRCAARLRKPSRRLAKANGYSYFYDPAHPYANSNGRVVIHRAVMEFVLGRQLRRDEHVHHINGDRSDNRIDNLEVLSSSAHMKVTASERVGRMRRLEAELAEYRRLYGPLPDHPELSGALDESRQGAHLTTRR